MLFTLKAAFVMVFAEKQKHMPKATGVGVCHTTGCTRGYSCLTTSWSGDYRRPSACLRLGLVSCIPETPNKLYVLKIM
jgi:hypothetical protein